MAKIGQGAVKANLNRIADDLYRAVMPPSPAISQQVPGDVGTVSPEQANAMMRGEVAHSTSNAPEGLYGVPQEASEAVKESEQTSAASSSSILKERVNQMQFKPKDTGKGMEL